MALYALSDLHLPLGNYKPMDVFGDNWTNYVERIKEEWTKEIKDEDVPLEDIFEEEIPLADVPKTGDGSAMWMVLSVLSALGLAVMFLFDRKRKEV